MRQQRVALAMLVTLVGIARATAATGQWTWIGPDGGYTWAVVADPSTATTSYAYTFAGLFKTTDGASSWNRLGGNLFLRAPGISATNPAVLYAPGGDPSVPGGGGIYKSVDGGATWAQVLATGILYAATVRTVTVDPTDAAIVYAGTEADGILKSVDGGATWAHSDTGISDFIGLDGPLVWQIVIDPQTPSTVYAITASGVNVWKSSNAGATWSPSNGGLPSGASGFLALDPQTPSTLYLLGAVLYKSLDSGASWTATGTGLPSGVGRVLAVDPQTPSTLYAGIADGFGTYGGLYESVDAGDTWAATGCAGIGVLDIAVRSDGGILIAAEDAIAYATHGGVYLSTDGAGSCPLASHGISAFQAVSLAAAGTLYMGDYYTGSYRTTDGGATWSEARGGLTGIDVLVHDLVVDPTTPSTVYQSSGNGLNDRVWKSIDGGDSWTTVSGPYPGYQSLAIDPNDANRLFLGVGRFLFGSIDIPARVDRSLDAGATWTSTSLFVNQINALAVDPTDGTRIYAGTDGGVYASVDGGGSFALVGNGIPVSQPVLGLVVDPTTPSVLYAIAVEYGSGTPGGVYKSVDSGVTWVLHNTGLSDPYLWAIAIDPAPPSSVYVATDHDGVFRSVNGAATWSPVNDGLFEPRARSLAVDPTVPRRLYVGTAASSVFVRDFPPPCPAGSDGEPCDDGNPCTLGDACASGVCQGTTPTCGDDVVAGCEACDDGAANGTPASCCTAACQLAPAGTPCADDGDLCTSDRCDAAGACTSAPSIDPLCLAAGPRGASLKIVNRSATTVDQVKFKWAKGPAVAKSAFGAPNGATTYALCVYDQTSSGTVVAYRGRPLPPCSTSPCWTDVATGWKLRSPGGPDGVTGVVLKSGLAGKAKVQVKARGASLDLPPLPLAKIPSVVAQVRTSDGACWGATFSAPTRNDTRLFNARSD